MRQAAMWRRWTAIALSVCCCFLSVACAGNSTRADIGGPPVFFMWNYNASVGATTPQEAYTLSAHFTPCRMPDDRMATSADQSVTWLVSGPRVGVAYLRATCRNAFHGNYVYRSFLEVVKGTVQGRHDAWYFDQVDREWPFPPTEDPTPTFEPLAPSLADLFPADAYRDWGPGRTSPPASPSVFIPVFWAWRAWIAMTPRDYVLGLVEDSGARPPDAIAMTVGGQPGWMTEANGMATIVAERPDGAVFFAGTGSASEVETVAARILPTAEEALGGPPPPTPTFTPSMGIGS